MAFHRIAYKTRAMRHEVAETETIATESITLPDVRAFCAVVDLGSVTGAANVLGETKGAVSRRLARLGAALGVSLLRRSPRRVVPTDEGRAYRASAGQAVEAFDDAARALVGARDVPRGLLRITAPSDLGVGLVPELCARFVDRHPEVRIEVLASDARLDLDAQHIDCALRVGVLRDSSLRVVRLRDLRVGLYASASYLHQHGTPKRPEDLRLHRIAAYTNMPRPLELPIRRGATVTRVTLEPTLIGDGAFVRELVAHGGAIAGMPRLVGDRDVTAGRLVRVLPGYEIDITVPLALLHAASAFVPAKVRAFRDIVLAELGPETARKRPRGD
jgi:DNA-binding transcriptional LysR family regulator